jgi:predicted O-methyltransferase YrrM
MSQEWTRDDLLLLGRGFMVPRILLTAVELDLFTKLKGKALSVSELCDMEGWDNRGLTILMDALAAEGLLSRGSDGKYSLPGSIAKYLIRGEEDSILPMILHGCHLWESWSNLTRIVTTGENTYPAERKNRPKEETEAFIQAMHVVGQLVAPMIADSLDLSVYSKMLDVGGGPGTYTMAFLGKAPQMTATLFDLPEVVEIGRKRLTKAGLIDRVRIVEGDYTKDDLPPGHDLALLSAIIHSNSREANRHLFRNVYGSLIQGGTILIRDHIMDPTRTFPVAGAIFAVNMLAATSGGNTYTFEEVKQDLESAGFKSVRMIREGQNMDQLVSAVK